MAFTLPELPYSYDALAPYMSAETLEYHHDKHHKAYVDKGNELIAGTGLENLSLEEAMVAAYKDKAKAGLFNQLGQHFNHIHFWNWMKSGGGGTKIPGKLEAQIASDFEGYEGFRKKFIEAGLTQFGSGWAWLVDAGSGLEIMKTANADLPLAHGAKALLTIDVWEHAYYIDFRNARPNYINTFLDSLVNWDFVATNLG